MFVQSRKNLLLIHLRQKLLNITHILPPPIQRNRLNAVRVVKVAVRQALRNGNHLTVALRVLAARNRQVNLIRKIRMIFLTLPKKCLS